jgi:hypothetical protein
MGVRTGTHVRPVGISAITTGTSARLPRDASRATGHTNAASLFRSAWRLVLLPKQAFSSSAMKSIAQSVLPPRYNEPWLEKVFQTLREVRTIIEQLQCFFHTAKPQVLFTIESSAKLR